MSFLHSLTPSQLLQGDDSPLNSAKPSKKMPVTGSEGVWTAADLSGEEEHLNSIIARYLLENVEEYRELSELRKQVRRLLAARFYRGSFTEFGQGVGAQSWRSPFSEAA